jgi:hypothetical protein
MGGSISIVLKRVHFGQCYVYSIVPRPTTPPVWQMFQALLVYFDHIHMWKVSGCSNHGPIPFLMLWQPISELYFWAWKYDMLAKMQCLCSGGNNRVSMRDHDPWFIPYGYGMDDWVVFWCTMLVLEPKESYSSDYSNSKTKLHWRICEIVIIIPNQNFFATYFLPPTQGLSTTCSAASNQEQTLSSL